MQLKRSQKLCQQVLKPNGKARVEAREKPSSTSNRAKEGRKQRLEERQSHEQG